MGGLTYLVYFELDVILNAGCNFKNIIEVTGRLFVLSSLSLFVLSSLSLFLVSDPYFVV